MSQTWRGMGGGIEVLENVNEMADLPDISAIGSEGVWYIESGEFAPDYIAPTNWDSSVGEFTDWFSLFDGRILGDIPDPWPESYLIEDWGDNQLSGRDGSNTTSYNGVTGFYRPEWSTESGFETPTVSDETLTIIDGEGVVTSEFNLNFSEDITWEFKDIDASNSGDIFGTTNITLFTTQTSSISINRYDSSYLVAVGSDEIALTEIDSSGSTNEFITFSNPSYPADIDVIRSSDGEWELIVDETSAGVETNTLHEGDEAFAILGRDDADVDINDIIIT